MKTIVAILAAASFVVAQDPCDGGGWRYSAHSGNCYQLFNTEMGWTAGEFKCVFLGGHHISVKNSDDNQFLSELAKQAGVVWLGAAQFGGSPEYVWSDRSPFAFENWRNRARPSFHPGKKCIKLNGTTGDWIQSCCKVPAAVICQKQGSGPQPAKQSNTPLPSKIVEDGSGLQGRFRRAST